MVGSDFLKASKVAIAGNRDAICGATLSQGCRQSGGQIVACIALPYLEQTDKLKRLGYIENQCMWPRADKWCAEQICSKLVAIYVHLSAAGAYKGQLNLIFTRKKC